MGFAVEDTTAAPLSQEPVAKPSKFGITVQRLTEKERGALAISDNSGVKVVTAKSPKPPRRLPKP